MTVTLTGTSSFEPSGYVTVTFPVMTSPGFLSFGIATVTFPLSSTVIPGVSLWNFVFSGISLPSFSFNGNSTVPPGFPSPSSYFGVYLSACSWTLIVIVCVVTLPSLSCALMVTV